MPTDFASMRKEIRELAAEVTETEPDELKDDVEFVDLGIDSMMALELAAAVEKKYKVVIPEEEIPKLRSLKNVYDLIETLLNK